MEAKLRKIGDARVYSRQQAAEALLISASSLDVLIKGKKIKVLKRGRYKYIPAAEVDRLSERSIPQIWPPKVDGKTTRHFGPSPPAKPPARRISETKSARITA